MTIVDNFKRSGAQAGLSFLACLFWAGSATAEVTLVEKDGWTFYANGRVGAFVSVAAGDDFPEPTPPLPGPDPTMQSPFPTHSLMGSGNVGPTAATGFGWRANVAVRQADNKWFSTRVRSGMISNVLGFGLRRPITDSTTVNGYIAIWTPIESLGRDKWYAVDADIREGYAELAGPWGSLTAGRVLTLIARTSHEIDVLYGHGYGVGFPCVDGVGPTCGQAGVGSLHPGYGAAMVYGTPSLGGLKLELGLFDPVRLLTVPYEHVPILRPEAALSFETPLGASGLFKLGVEGLYQPVGQVVEEDTDNDPATPNVEVEKSDSLWGVSGGVRLEVGPARIGVGAFHGAGLGLVTALQSTDATAGPAVLVDPVTNARTIDPNNAEIRTFTGFHGQVAGVFGNLQVGVGGGVGMVGELDSDEINPALSPGDRHLGISAALYYHVSDAVVVGADYMRFMATWRGAPAVAADAAGNPVITGNRLPAEEQSLNFINAGVTYHW